MPPGAGLDARASVPCNGRATSTDCRYTDPLIAIAGGGGVNLYNSMGNAWTADYLKITGELDVDLRSNIAAEARAKIVYERLINFTTDAGTKDALQFLMTREITHMKAFTAALESLNKPRFSIGRIPPTPGLVDQFFNESTGAGEDGGFDARGPWNDGGDWTRVEAPAFQALQADDDAVGDARSIPERPVRPLSLRCWRSCWSTICVICCMPKDNWSRRSRRWRRPPMVKR